MNGYSISNQKEKVHRSIGYCPQFDALMPLLTAREHLKFFARLRGIPEKNVKQVSEWAMDKVGLNAFADRLSGDLSGGNKRKLSTAIALVGNPSVICLDEPTSGVDARARRLLSGTTSPTWSERSASPFSPRTAWKSARPCAHVW